MKDIKEYKAEIFRRSQERIRQRKTKHKKILTVSVCFCLALVCSVNLIFNTGLRLNAEDLMKGIEGNEPQIIDDLSSQNAEVTDFALRLLKENYAQNTNTLISPLSVLSALAMISNGADAETLEEMESVFGMTREDLNLYLYSYTNALPQGEKYKLKLANSLWITEDENFTVNRDFLQTNADYFSADVYKAAFDESTCRDINAWVKDATDGMIPSILDRISDNTVMYLINALSFEAEWPEVYKSTQIHNDSFTKEDGTKQPAEFMIGEADRFLKIRKATGFIKYYSDCKYAFAALLPNEGVSVAEFLDSLDGASLSEVFAHSLNRTVYAWIPKFESEYTVEMSDVLKNMGINRAFDPQSADFDSLGSYTDGYVYISRILHKTRISVAEKGTKAGAVTVAAVDGLSAPGDNKKFETVYLDRPFVYMLIDCENNIPFFIGTMMDIQK